MTAAAQAAWRWRVLYLRAKIDAVAFNGTTAPADQKALNQSFAELDAIYHVERRCNNYMDAAAHGSSSGIGNGGDGGNDGDVGPLNNCTLLVLRPGFKSDWPAKHMPEC